MDANIALLIDFENLATGCEKEGLGRFDVRVVMRRFKDKGRILVARAYADWGMWTRFKNDLVSEGVSLQELSHRGLQAKNRADIALVVDAMEMAFTRSYVDTYVILSGDSDFSPLVMRLKELNKRVIGCGTRGSTSHLLADLCDEFLFYDNIRTQARPAEPEPDDEGSLTLEEGFELLLETLENLQRDDPGPVHSSVMKAAMKRKVPTFSETDLGFRTFARFLEVAAEKSLVALSRDQRAGGYQVEVPGAPAESRVVTPPPGADAQKITMILGEEGVEVGTASDRAVVLEEFVAACAERARRNRKCAVEYIIGDLLRRTRQAHASIPSRVVKGIVHALARAGALLHPDGEPVRTPTAPFVPPTDPKFLEDVLDGVVARVMAAHGITATTPGVAEVLRDPRRLDVGGVPQEAPQDLEEAPVPEGEAPPTDDPPTEEVATRAKRPTRRGRRRGSKSAATGGEPSGDATSEPAE